MKKHVIVNRLEKLYKIAKAIKPREFDMYNIMYRKSDGCGTVGCMLGWAGMDKGFRKAGLITSPDTNNCSFKGETGYAPLAFFGDERRGRLGDLFFADLSASKEEKLKELQGIIKDIKCDKYVPACMEKSNA